MMANVQNIEINIHKHLIEYINWLKSYKNIADEVFSLLVEVDMPDEYLRAAQKLALRALNMSAHEEPIDTGRWRMCEEIAKSVPFDVDTIYETYTYVLGQNKKQTQVVTLNKQLQDMKTILEHAQSWQLKPLTVAIEIFEINK